MKEKILHILKEAQGYVSGEALSRMLSVSRSAVWKSINALRKDGYVIDSVTNKGYCLQISPDILSASEVCSGLATKQIGKKLLFFSQVDSTNEELKRQARAGAENGWFAQPNSRPPGKAGLAEAGFPRREREFLQACFCARTSPRRRSRALRLRPGWPSAGRYRSLQAARPK